MADTNEPRKETVRIALPPPTCRKSGGSRYGPDQFPPRPAAHARTTDGGATKAAALQRSGSASSVGTGPSAAPAVLHAPAPKPAAAAPLVPKPAGPVTPPPMARPPMPVASGTKPVRPPTFTPPTVDAVRRRSAAASSAARCDAGRGPPPRPPPVHRPRRAPVPREPPLARIPTVHRRVRRLGRAFSLRRPGRYPLRARSRALLPRRLITRVPLRRPARRKRPRASASCPNRPRRPAPPVKMAKTQPLMTAPEAKAPAAPVKVAPAAPIAPPAPELERDVDAIPLPLVWAVFVISAVTFLIQIWNYFAS